MNRTSIIVAWLTMTMGATAVQKLDAAPDRNEETKRQSRGNLRMLMAALSTYIVQTGVFPDRLDELQEVLGKDRFAETMRNPRTGDAVGYSYRPPKTSDGLKAQEGEVVLIEMKEGKEDPEGARVRFVGSLAKTDHPGAKPAPRFRITDLGAIGHYGCVWAINNNGQAVGAISERSGNDWVERAFMYSEGKTIDIHRKLGYAQSDIHDINDAGVIVGIVKKPRASNGIGFAWQEGKLKIIHSSGAHYTTLYGINNKGMAVGISAKGGKRHAIMVDTNAPELKPTDLGVLPDGDDSVATGINEKGVIVGSGPAQPGKRTRCLVWEGDLPTIAPIFAEEDDVGNTLTRDINDNGVMVGCWGSRQRALDYRAFVWRKDWGRIEPPAGGGTLGGAHGVNNYDLVVGHSPAFIWCKGRGLVKLQDMLPAASGWLLAEARAINDLGQIVGKGKFGNEPLPHGYLLTMFELAE